jgi:hypothetical protein
MKLFVQLAIVAAFAAAPMIVRAEEPVTAPMGATSDSGKHPTTTDEKMAPAPAKAAHVHNGKMHGKKHGKMHKDEAAPAAPAADAPKM